MKRWTLYEIPDVGVFRKLTDLSVKWPNVKFQATANRLGYKRLVTDRTLVGGYFVNDDNGNCLVCVPYDTDPKTVY